MTHKDWIPAGYVPQHPQPASQQAQPSPQHITPSPQYRVAKPAEGRIVDPGGHRWAVTTGEQITINRQVDPASGTVDRLIFVGEEVWQSCDYGWYSKRAPEDEWVHSPTGPVSADGTTITGSDEAIIDAAGFVTQLTEEGQIRLDNRLDKATKNVVLVQYSGGQIWQQIANGDWYHTKPPSQNWTYSATAPGETPIGPPATGHIELGVQSGDPWGADGSCQNIFSEFATQMQESPIEFCTFLEEHVSNWQGSAHYSATGIVHARSFHGGDKLAVASVGVPLVNSGSTWQHDFPAIARGEWDNHLRGALDEYVDNGLQVMIRPGWEMNGTWYRWSCTHENAQQYVEAFRRIAQVAHSYTRAAIKVNWNPGYMMGGSVDFTSVYPGDEYVDYIGIDTYGAASGVPNDSPFHSYSDNLHWCVDDAIKFSLQHGKPLSFPEVGCGPNDVDFPRNLAEKICSTKARVNLFSIWDQQTGVGEIGGHWSKNPECGEAWRQCLAKIRATNAW